MEQQKNGVGTPAEKLRWDTGKDIYFSLYSRDSSLIPIATSFLQEMQSIRDGDYKKEVDEARTIKFVDGDEAYKKFRKTVHCFTPGVYSKKQGKGNPAPEELTGLLTLDIDDKTQDQERNKEVLIQFPWVLAVGRSIGGYGLFAIIKCNPNRLLESHTSAVNILESRKVKVAKGQHNPNRLRYVSYDPDLYFVDDPAAAPEVPLIYPVLAETHQTVARVNNDRKEVFQEIVRIKSNGATLWKEGERHSHLISVASWCNAIGMSQSFCLAMAEQVCRPLMEHGNNYDIAHRIEDIYRRYVHQHNSKEWINANSHIEPNESAELASVLSKSRVFLFDHFEKAPTFISFVHRDQSAPFGTCGNFTLVIGKAKSKKTFLMVMVLAACLGHLIFQGTIKTDLPSDKYRILLFDTEQSKYHVWKRLQAIAALAGAVDLKNIEVYSLREYPPVKRCEIIEYGLIESNPEKNVGIVVIDGVRDLISDINDPKEATHIATKLLQWTTLAGCHIVTVLHQNKGDLNARGHVGTELVNKAETVISVTAQKDDKNISVVEAEHTKDIDFPAFAFRITDIGTPEIIDDFGAERETANKKGSFDVYSIDPAMHHLVLKKIFTHKRQFSRGELIAEIKTAWASCSQIFGDNIAKGVISYYSQMGWIRNEAGPGKVARWGYAPHSV